MRPVAGLSDPGAATGRIGQAIFDKCEDSLPWCVAHVIRLIRDTVVTEKLANVPVGAAAGPPEGSGGPTAPAGSPETPEGATGPENAATQGEEQS